MSAPRYALEVEGLGKAYRRYSGRLGRALGTLGLGRLGGFEDCWVLQDVDLRLRPGSTLGICGANGAGKSTLLRLLAGISAPSAGRFRTSGSVSSILELGAGFHPGFTGRENVVFSAILMGLARREARRRAEEMIEFADLGAAIDDPLRTYSAGMALRLGFSVAVVTDPEVLLIDEVFAVGDLSFQKKCVDRLQELRRRGRTILLCTHSLYDLRVLCEQALWIHDGRVASRGDSVRVTNDYASFQEERMEGRDVVRPGARGAEGPPPEAAEGPRILRVEVHAEGRVGPVREVATGDTVEVRVWWRNPDPERFPIHVGVGFLRQDRVLCLGTATHLDGARPTGTGGCTVLRLPRLRLLAGRYLLPVWLVDGDGVHRYQEFLTPEPLLVRSSALQAGVYVPESEWSQRDEPPEP